MTSSPQIAIIDYQLGNLFSVNKACSLVGFKPIITNTLDKIKESDGIIIPGVGSYSVAIDFLSKNNLDQIILEKVKQGTPLLGICLGMQLLLSKSFEFGEKKGLGLIPGEVKKFDREKNYKIPHVGWSSIHTPPHKSWSKSILNSTKEGTAFYFVHSYYCVPEQEESILSLSHISSHTFCSSIQSENIIGTQYHPEKSGPQGLALYKHWKSTF